MQSATLPSEGIGRSLSAVALPFVGMQEAAVTVRGFSVFDGRHRTMVQAGEAERALGLYPFGLAAVHAYRGCRANPCTEPAAYAPGVYLEIVGVSPPLVEGILPACQPPRKASIRKVATGIPAYLVYCCVYLRLCVLRYLQALLPVTDVEKWRPHIYHAYTVGGTERPTFPGKEAARHVHEAACGGAIGGYCIDIMAGGIGQGES